MLVLLPRRLVNVASHESGTRKDLHKQWLRTQSQGRCSIKFLLYVIMLMALNALMLLICRLRHQHQGSVNVDLVSSRTSKLPTRWSHL